MVSLRSLKKENRPDFGRFSAFRLADGQGRRPPPRSE
jgi:hypothetical protein